MADLPKTTVKVTKMGPLVHAPEWALRHAHAIIGDLVQDFDTQAELGKRIAEALYCASPPMMGGRGSPCQACNGTGHDYEAERKASAKP